MTAWSRWLCTTVRKKLAEGKDRELSWVDVSIALEREGERDHLIADRKAEKNYRNAPFGNVSGSHDSTERSCVTRGRGGGQARSVQRLNSPRRWSRYY